MSTPDMNPICAGQERSRPQDEVKTCKPSCVLFHHCQEAHRKMDTSPEQLANKMKSPLLSGRLAFGGDNGFQAEVAKSVAASEGIKTTNAARSLLGRRCLNNNS